MKKYSRDELKEKIVEEVYHRPGQSVTNVLRKVLDTKTCKFGGNFSKIVNELVEEEKLTKTKKGSYKLLYEGEKSPFKRQVVKVKKKETQQRIQKTVDKAPTQHLPSELEENLFKIRTVESQTHNSVSVHIVEIGTEYTALVTLLRDTAHCMGVLHNKSTLIKGFEVKTQTATEHALILNIAEITKNEIEQRG